MLYLMEKKLIKSLLSEHIKKIQNFKIDWHGQSVSG